MKKIIGLMFLLTFAFMACQKPETADVIVPNGVPSIGQSYMEYNTNKHDFTIERVNGPQPLVAAFTGESHDIIIAPVNLGANLYQKGSPYQLAGVLTWSNLQIISKTEINDISDLAGKDITAFGQGSVPQMIIDYLFESITFDQEVNIQYDAASAQESFMMFMQDDDGIAIVSEPVTTSAKDQVDPLYVLDLADVWSDYTDLDLFPQAGVFVHQDLSETMIDNYLFLISESSEFVYDDPSRIAEMCETMDYPFEKTIIQDSIPTSQINFQATEDVYEIVETFLTMVYDYNPQLIGENMPDEDWYYSRP
ncbi:MAG: hypothetical protein ACLFPM_07165 [Candidatus Izemoplasmatales bacterium]